MKDSFGVVGVVGIMECVVVGLVETVGVAGGNLAVLGTAGKYPVDIAAAG